MKKLRIDKLQLACEGPVMEALLRPLFADWRAKAFSDAEFVAQIVLIYLLHRKPNQWLSGVHADVLHTRFASSIALNKMTLFERWPNKIRAKLPPEMTLHQLVAKFSFYGIPLSINRALARWMEGVYPLQLWTHIPTAEELLAVQTRGLRGVTVFSEARDLSRMINPLRDPLEFILHDLEHADRFFLEPDNQKGQIALFKKLLNSIQMDFFGKMMQQDPTYHHDLEYLMADMNSYSVHMIQYLKAITLNHFLRMEGKSLKENLSDDGHKQYWQFCELLAEQWQMPEATSDAFRRLNTSRFDLKTDGLTLERFFLPFAEPYKTLAQSAPTI